MPDETIVAETITPDVTGVETLETVVETKVYDWRDDIHPDVKADEVWKNVPDVKTLTKAYADANKYAVGAIKMPGKDATPDDWSAFHKKLGRPESAEGYTLNDVMKDDAQAKSMRAVAHTAGLTPTQWKVMTEGWQRIGSENAQQSAATRDETVSALQAEWGGAYDKKIALSQRLLKTFGGDETFQAISTNPIGNHKGFLTMLANIAEAMAEEELISKNVEGVATKEDAQAELDTLTATDIYLNPRKPGHAAAVKRATELFQLVYN